MASRQDKSAAKVRILDLLLGGGRALWANPNRVPLGRSKFQLWPQIFLDGFPKRLRDQSSFIFDLPLLIFSQNTAFTTKILGRGRMKEQVSMNQKADGAIRK